MRLRDVAKVELGPQSVVSSSMFNGLKAVFVGVSPAPTANPLTVIDAVRKAMPDIQAQLPAGLKANIAYDATKFIQASIDEVIATIVEAAVIVIIVIFLFLGNIRSTIIPLVTIPLSLVGVLFLLLVLRYSINLLTLLAMVLAIGLVVDDAIVVVENIYRHIEEGETPFQAALHGARDIAGPVISMTDEAVRECRFAMVDVGDDGEVARQVHEAGHYTGPRGDPGGELTARCRNAGYVFWL